MLNRANGLARLFEDVGAYRDFVQIVTESLLLHNTALFAYCLMPNHWHMLLSPRTDNDLARLVQRFTVRQTQRLHAYRNSVGRGHFYQGRYKSFPVCNDRHLLTVCRYVEANPLRANLVSRAEDWPWSSASTHMRLPLDDDRFPRIPLSGLPVQLASDWRTFVNEPVPARESTMLRECVNKGTPFGHRAWSEEAAEHLHVPDRPRPRGRPFGYRKEIVRAE